MRGQPHQPLEEVILDASRCRLDRSYHSPCRRLPQLENPSTLNVANPRRSTAWLALAYLIVAGSIMGFTAYIWLLHHESPTKVGTYAYVNPVVAVLVGYFLGGELIGLRTIVGTLLVLVSVVLITRGGGGRKESEDFVTVGRRSLDSKQDSNVSSDLGN
ncbi:MAG TPA: EamA family transporter [Candidatus Sulfotelmatobacter sp.]